MIPALFLATTVVLASVELWRRYRYDIQGAYYRAKRSIIGGKR